MLSAFETHAPDILTACKAALDAARADLDFLRLDSAAYAQIPDISLDYAIMEKFDRIECVPLGTPWSDVGSWATIWGALDKDDSGNAVRGNGNVHLLDTRNSLAVSEGPYVSILGLENVLVIATNDAVLVADKDHADSVKRLTEHLNSNGHRAAEHHTRVHRPWGWYEGLSEGDRFQVKCIMVKPGGQLSLQCHHHRSEHWVVVRGTMSVTKGEKTVLLGENESTYIAVGEQHRLANPGTGPAFLIEVQSGSYLGEDDIERFEDVYGRGLPD
jgi:mannose-1-phosphate guanylyltransferase/mannose-6-phosphate isomerase